MAFKLIGSKVRRSQLFILFLSLLNENDPLEKDCSSLKKESLLKMKDHVLFEKGVP